MISYEYKQFLYEQILEYLPSSFVKIGRKYNGRCPICGDSKKSSIKKRGWWYADRDCSYYCFNCGTSLSGIKFLEVLSGYNYDDIKKKYLKLFAKNGNNFSLSSFCNNSEDNEELSIFNLKSLVRPEWKQPLSDKAKKYLHDRFVDCAPFLKDQLYSWYSKKNEEYILIPWILNGIDAYYQLNDFEKHSPMKYLFPKDKKKLVYGLDNIDISWPYIILFEGVFDSLFVKNAICTGTKSVSDYQLKIIKERYPKHQICISFDNDHSGIDSMIKLIKQNNDFKFFRWFDENTKEKDVNDYIKKKKNVNIFADSKKIEQMIADKLVMKMWLIKNNLWTNYDKNTSETRKI